MAVVKNLMVRAGADFSGLIRAANRAANSTQRMERTMRRSFSGIERAVGGLKNMLGALGVAVSLGALISAAKDAKEAFDEQAISEAKLAQVMRNTMAASQGEIQSIKELASAQQRLGVIGDEVQLSGAQELATYLEQTSSLKTLIPVMNDMLAQQYGLNATQENAAQIGTMLGKVMNGQVNALSRYGYKFTEAQARILKYGNEAQRAAVLAEVVEQSVGGMNEALARTPAGRLQQVKNTLGDIKEEFGRATTTMLTVFLPAIEAVVNALSAVAAWANRVANTFAKVFGGTTVADDYGEALGGAGAGAEDLSEGLDDAAASAKKLAMADFDNLHILRFGKDTGADQGEESGGGGGTGSLGLPGEEEEKETVGWLQTALEKLKELGERLHFDKIKEALVKVGEAAKKLAGVILEKLGPVWDSIIVPLGEWAAEGLTKTLERLAVLINNLADLLDGRMSLKEFWQQLNGIEKALGLILALNTGARIVSAIWAIITAIRGVIGFVTGLIGLVRGIAFAFVGVGQTAAGAGSAIRKAFTWILGGKLFAGIKAALSNAWAAVAGFFYKVNGAITVAKGGTVSLNQALTASFGATATTIAGVGTTIAGLGLGVWKFVDQWKNGMTAAKTALMVLGVAIAAVGAVILGAPAAVTAIVAAIVAVVATLVLWLKNNWTEVKAFFQKLGQDIAALWEKCVTKVRGFFEKCLGAIKNTWSTVSGFFSSLAQGAQDTWNRCTTTVRDYFRQALDGIKSAWGSLGQWFDSNIVQPISGGIRELRNLMRGCAEGIANSFIGAINWVVDAINSIEVDIPDWVPFVGGESWSPSLPRFSHISIPRLATGDVIQPNRPFAAILGDQQSGVNIETPERLLRQIYREESGANQILGVLGQILRQLRQGQVIKMNDRELGRTVRELLGEMSMSGAALDF